MGVWKPRILITELWRSNHIFWPARIIRTTMQKLAFLLNFSPQVGYARLLQRCMKLVTSLGENWVWKILKLESNGTWCLSRPLIVPEQKTKPKSLKLQMNFHRLNGVEWHIDRRNLGRSLAWRTVWSTKKSSVSWWFWIGKIGNKIVTVKTIFVSNTRKRPRYGFWK